MKLKGKISMCRSQGPGGEHSMHIEVVDDTSRVRFVDIKLTMEQFGMAVTGLGYTDCDLEVIGLDKVGKRLETKIIQIPISRDSPYGKDFYPYMKKLVEPYEIDGWLAEDYDIKTKNHHKVSSNDKGKTTYTVSFRRFVES